MINRRQPPRSGGGAFRRDVSAVVKWFNPTKGFGFVQLTDGTPDAFLHASVVEQSGHRDIWEGTKIVCDITEGQKGPQVVTIHSVEPGEAPPPRRPASPGYGGGGGYGGDRGDRGGYASGPTTQVEGTVKFFNAEKGFGFVTPDDGGKDVYVASRALQKAGLGSLTSDQRVRLQIRMGQKGPMADSVELI